VDTIYFMLPNTFEEEDYECVCFIGYLPNAIPVSRFPNEKR